MRKIVLIALVAAAELLAPPLLPAQGTLYVLNLDQTPTGSAPVGSDSWIAQHIYTGHDAGDYSLNSIQLLMNAASGSPGGFTVSVYSSRLLNGNEVPGTSLGSLSGSDPGVGGVFTYSASGLMLSPLTHYFIVLTGATPVAQGAYNWSAVNAFTVSQWEIYPAYCSSTDGLSWTEHSRSSVFQLAIYATPVPEPSALGLIAVGLSALLAYRRRAGPEELT